MQKYNTYDNVKKLIDIWYMTVTDVQTNDESWNDAEEDDIYKKINVDQRKKPKRK
jgi:hypothetical protein